MSSKKRLEGYLLTDHRAGPGIPSLGMPDGKLVETVTLYCCHCSANFLPNPNRERPREYCRRCDKYLCDPCARTASKSDYTHRSFQDIAEMVRSGKWTLVGPVSDQNLIPNFIEV